MRALLWRNRHIVREATTFIIVGVVNTALFFLIYNLLRVAGLSPFQANAVGVTIGAVANFYGNRRFTFRIRGSERVGRQLLEFGVVFGVTLALSTGALEVLHRIDPTPSRLAENIALLFGTGMVVVARFLLLRMWVFKASRAAPRAEAERPEALSVDA